MLTQTEIQQESAPTKKRIGRIRFLLEFLIAAFLVKAGSGALGGLTGIGVVVPLSVFGLGFGLAIWATIRRLRDIKRSVWWVTVLIVPLILGMALGIAIILSGPGITDSTYVKTVGIAYMVVYLLFLGVLLFWPSPFPKDAEVQRATGGQASTEPSDTLHRASGAAIKDSLHIKYHNVLRMNRLNGWQRIGAILSVFWCFGVVGKTGYESYETASANAELVECCKEVKKNQIQKEYKVGDYISDCEVLGVCTKIILKPVTPQLLPLLTLLFFPIAGGWLVVLVAISATKWVKEGFKAK